MGIVNKFKENAKNIGLGLLMMTSVAASAQYGHSGSKTTAGASTPREDDGISVSVNPGVRMDVATGKPRFDVYGRLAVPFSKGDEALKFGAFGEVGYTMTGQKIGISASYPTLYGRSTFSAVRTFTHAWGRIGPMAELDLGNEDGGVKLAAGAWVGAVNFPGQRVNNLYVCDYEAGTQLRVSVGKRLPNGNEIGINAGMNTVLWNQPNRNLYNAFRGVLFDLTGVRKPNRVGTEFNINVAIPLKSGKSSRTRKNNFTSYNAVPANNVDKIDEGKNNILKIYNWHRGEGASEPMAILVSDQFLENCNHDGGILVDVLIEIPIMNRDIGQGERYKGNTVDYFSSTRGRTATIG